MDIYEAFYYDDSLIVKVFLGTAPPGKQGRGHMKRIWTRLEFPTLELQTPWFDPGISGVYAAYKSQLRKGSAQAVQRLVDAYNRQHDNNLRIVLSTHNRTIVDIVGIRYKRKGFMKSEQYCKTECAHVAIDYSGSTPRCKDCGKFVSMKFIP